MKVAVVGLGTYGRELAVTLARGGAEVIAIDANMDLVDDVKDEVAIAVKLDATDERELRAQGVNEVDVLVACIGDNFEVNQLLIIQAKKLGIKKVVARTPSPVHARILKLIGADTVVMPEVQAAQVTADQILQPSLKAYFRLIEGYSVAEIEAPASFHGKTLIELNLKQKYRVNLLVIRRPGKMDGDSPKVNAVPLGSDTIESGDIIAVAGLDDDIKRLLIK
jgi:trk system potassium uptake protein